MHLILHLKRHNFQDPNRSFWRLVITLQLCYITAKPFQSNLDLGLRFCLEGILSSLISCNCQLRNFLFFLLRLFKIFFLLTSPIPISTYFSFFFSFYVSFPICFLSYMLSIAKIGTVIYYLFLFSFKKFIVVQCIWAATQAWIFGLHWFDRLVLSTVSCASEILFCLISPETDLLIWAGHWRMNCNSQCFSF